MRETSVCFTGHREIPSNKYEFIKQTLIDMIKELANSGYTDFYAGGASGFDMLASFCVLELKKEYDIRLHIILPYRRSVSTYSSYERYKQKELLERADSVECLFERYLSGCFHTRNRKLVDSSSVCVAFLEKNSGGTYYTVNYAKENGLKVVLV